MLGSVSLANSQRLTGLFGEDDVPLVGLFLSHALYMNLLLFSVPRTLGLGTTFFHFWKD